MNCKTYILTGDIQSGKSTALLECVEIWKRHQFTIGGLLNIVEDDQKWFLDLSNGQKWPMETNPGDEDKIQVGRYTFSHEAFARAQKCLSTNTNDVLDFFIVDEIGKLELKNDGLETSLTNFLKGHHPIETLILVIRSSLLDEVGQRYHLGHAKLITKEDLQSLHKIK